MPITYRELKEKLESIPEEHLDDDVTVYYIPIDEYTQMNDLLIADDKNDVLNAGHPYLTVQDDLVWETF